MANFSPVRHLKYFAIPTLVILFLAVYPQLNLYIVKEPNWHGAYFVANYDEVAYSAYVNSLIEGKSRLYDPYLAAETTHESLYSIQFVPSYAIALPARFLGISTSTTFVILIILSAFASALFIYWLLFQMTGDELLSSVGILVICCLGTMAAYQGELRSLIEGRVLIDYFPFLRRYQPGFAFPFFFLFCASIWFSLTTESRNRAIVYSSFSAVLLVLLIFSYFYLWTAAIAWLACVYFFNLIWNRQSMGRVLINAGIVGAAAIAALIPYFKMLSERSPNVDSVQLIANTHMPQFGSVSLIIGLIILAGIAIFAFRGRIQLTSARSLFAMAFASTPVILFNQQVITGRSLQPVHYEIFISNYLVLTALILFLSLISTQIGRKEDEVRSPAFGRALVYLAVFAALWGVVEAAGSTKRDQPFADFRDESIPAIQFIQRQERNRPAGEPRGAILATDFVTADFIPTVATLRPLWSPHSSSTGGLDLIENKNLFYRHLYYCGFTAADLAEALRANSFEVTAAIFGGERALPALGFHAAAISAQEISREATLYMDFIKAFNRDSASTPVLEYIILPAKDEKGLANLDRWYQRDDGTVLGSFRVYKLVLKP